MAELSLQDACALAAVAGEAALAIWNAPMLRVAVMAKLPLQNAAPVYATVAGVANNARCLLIRRPWLASCSSASASFALESCCCLPFSSRDLKMRGSEELLLTSAWLLPPTRWKLSNILNPTGKTRLRSSATTLPDPENPQATRSVCLQAFSPEWPTSTCNGGWAGDCAGERLLSCSLSSFSGLTGLLPRTRRRIPTRTHPRTRQRSSSTGGAIHVRISLCDLNALRRQPLRHF